MDIHYLKYAIIELTSVCNLRCMHCYNHWKSSDGKTVIPENSYRKAFRLLDFLIRHTTVENIVFTGGEPTLGERFIELILHAKLEEKKVTVITNGNGPENIYRQLITLQADMIEVSIHSLNEQTHDRITGCPGSWQRAVSTLHLMRENKIKATPIIVITSINQTEIVETVDFFYQMGIRQIMVNRYNIGGEGLKQTHLSASATELRLIFQKLNLYAETHSIRIFSGVCTPFCLLNPEDYPNIGFGSCSDYVYQRPLTFDLDGNLRLCNHSPIVAGNIYHQTFEEIFSSDYVCEWNNLNIEHCRSCNKLSVCKGGCRAASEQSGRSLQQADPIIETLQIFPHTDYFP